MAVATNLKIYFGDMGWNWVEARGQNKETAAVIR